MGAQIPDILIWRSHCFDSSPLSDSYF